MHDRNERDKTLFHTRVNDKILMHVNFDRTWLDGNKYYFVVIRQSKVKMCILNYKQLKLLNF